MGISAITIFCNESFRIPKWKEYYSEYRKDIDLYIIVDNNSNKKEYEILKESFPTEIIIHLDKNMGVTGAYNAGLKECFNHKEIDAVAFIGNDIKIENNGLKKLYDFLMSDDKFGEVSPILLKKDSMIIEDNGDYFTKNLVMNEYDIGKNIDKNIKSHISDGLPGAMNMAKIEMYNKIGLMDEKLFMYSDEVDMGIRAKNAGYLFLSYPNVKAWHQHEFVPGKTNRLPFSNYLVARNKVYLAGKHYGFWRKIYVYFSMLYISIKTIIKGIFLRDKSQIKSGNWQIKGANRGLFNIMKHNKYSNPGRV